MEQKLPNRFGILIVQMGYKALFVCPCSSDLSRAAEEGKRGQAEGEMECLF